MLSNITMNTTRAEKQKHLRNKFSWSPKAEIERVGDNGKKKWVHHIVKTLSSSLWSPHELNHWIIHSYFVITMVQVTNLGHCFQWGLRQIASNPWWVQSHTAGKFVCAYPRLDNGFQVCFLCPFHRNEDWGSDSKSLIQGLRISRGNSILPQVSNPKYIHSFTLNKSKSIYCRSTEKGVINSNWGEKVS